MALPGKILTDQKSIKQRLDSSKTIAVLGLSSNPEKDSNMVARYMQEQGYRIIPVHPKESEILGEKAYASLDDIPESVDIVDVFRRPEAVLAHAREALRLKPKVFWMQLGITNQQAAETLIEAGIDVVMNKCLKIEHANLCRQQNV